jgi:hypothetical protein
MKTGVLSFVVCFALLPVGCKTGDVNGRLDQVLLPEVERWGGNARGQGTAPPVTARWTVERDRFGTVLQTSDLSLEQVNDFLSQAFGTPSKGTTTVGEKQQWVIPARTAGVSIWFCEAHHGVRITVLKPLKVPE